MRCCCWLWRHRPVFLFGGWLRCAGLLALAGAAPFLLAATALAIVALVPLSSPSAATLRLLPAAAFDLAATGGAVAVAVWLLLNACALLAGRTLRSPSLRSAPAGLAAGGVSSDPGAVASMHLAVVWGTKVSVLLSALARERGALGGGQEGGAARAGRGRLERGAVP